MNSNAQQSQATNFFKWSQPKSIPDADGFAGSYAGVSNGSLIVAGGSNFPGNKRPWDGGTKTWYDKIFVLERMEGTWKEVGKLPRPMAYGVALTYKGGVLCLGGGDAKQNYNDVFILSYSSGKIKTTFLPSMPSPLINACGVIINNVVYIMGGITTPTGVTENNFWILDLSAPAVSQKWKILQNLPGLSRMLATAGASKENVYLFGGVHLVKEDSALQREYLKDCWEYNEKQRWRKIADLPYTLAATPSPAYNTDRLQLLLFGGDDGLNALKVTELKDTHPGFRNEILSYNTITNSWSVAGKIPIDKKADSAANPHNSIYAPVTTPLVIWNNNIVIAGGEARPAVRSNRVLIAKAQHSGR
jgi:N-acetylneuraminic acid mutarotase